MIIAYIVTHLTKDTETKTPKGIRIMECIAPRKAIANTFESVRVISFDEKKNRPYEQEKINAFLDKLLDVKKSLTDKAEKITEISGKIEQITWFNELDEECLMILNDLISSAKDLHSSLIRHYVDLGFLRKEGLAKEEIKTYKSALDDLRESYEDLESVFFFLPEMDGFVETTKALSLI